MADFQTRLTELEDELSRIEATFGEIVHEPFPEFPGLNASRSDIAAWDREHERRTRRLRGLMESRADVLKEIRRLVSRPGEH